MTKNVVECVLLQSLQDGPGDDRPTRFLGTTGPALLLSTANDNDVYHNDNPSGTIRRENN